MTSSCLKSPEEIFKEKMASLWMDVEQAKKTLFNAVGDLHANLPVTPQSLPDFEATKIYVQAGVELSVWLNNWREDFLPTKEERDEDGETQEGPSKD